MTSETTHRSQEEARQTVQRVLLAGATGTLGARLIPALTQHYETTALVRPGSEAKLRETGAELSAIRLCQVTDPSTLEGVCEGVDTVVTTVGITRQKDGLTYDQVDYQANVNLLRAAERAGVRRFLYVSVVGADKPSRVPGIDAKHRFEQELMTSSIDWIIIRPSGFFTDLLDVLKMAEKGTVWQWGNGRNAITPIDVTDLAGIIASSLSLERKAIEVGGPETLTWNEIAEICFNAIGRHPRVVHLPRWTLSALLAATKPFSQSKYGVLSFVGHVQTGDTSAPNVGTRTFSQFLSEQTP